jgi:hypothetical protein
VPALQVLVAQAGLKKIDVLGIRKTRSRSGRFAVWLDCTGALQTHILLALAQNIA